MDSEKRLINGADIIYAVSLSKEYPTKSIMYSVSSGAGYDAATFRLAVREWWDDIWEKSPYRSPTCRIPENMITRKGYLASKRDSRVKVKVEKPKVLTERVKRVKEVKKVATGRRSRTAMAQMGGFTLADLMMDQACLCPNCGMDLIAHVNYELDHIQPISRGGCNEYWNLQFLCKPCNRAKHDKDPFVWAALAKTELPAKFLAHHS